MKNSSDSIVDRTRDFVASSAVPQPTAPPCVPTTVRNVSEILADFIDQSLSIKVGYIYENFNNS